jgi:hypothetical protein
MFLIFDASEPYSGVLPIPAASLEQTIEATGE